MFEDDKVRHFQRQQLCSIEHENSQTQVEQKVVATDPRQTFRASVNRVHRRYSKEC